MKKSAIAILAATTLLIPVAAFSHDKEVEQNNIDTVHMQAGHYCNPGVIWEIHSYKPAIGKILWSSRNIFPKGNIIGQYNDLISQPEYMKPGQKLVTNVKIRWKYADGTRTTEKLSVTMDLDPTDCL